MTVMNIVKSYGKQAACRKPENTSYWSKPSA
jgi:hypothetical protein